MIELMQQGGPVMWMLLACSVLAGVIFLERLLHLHRAQINASEFLKGIYNILRRDNIVEAVSICEETPGPVPSIVRAAVLHHDEPSEQIARAIQEAGLHEVPRLERNLNMLLTLAQVSPLIGLLGTVLGLMQVLIEIEQNSPLVHSGDLSGGLWQALISTAAGLAVAIPTYTAYNFLVGRVESVILDMERSSGEILTFLVNRARGADLP
jgi:biopolymer transport protein ExbB